MRNQRNRLLESAKIVALSILASVVFGILHDQVTIRISPEYFTKWPFHADVFQHPSLTITALFWGVAATWWVGLILGIPLAFVCTTGEGVWWTWSRLLKPLLITISFLFFSSFVSYLVAKSISFRAPAPMLNYSPDSDEELIRFSQVLVAHNASYIGGAIGGLALVIYVVRRRAKWSRTLGV